MMLRKVSSRSYELNRNKNYISMLRVGTFTRQDDGSVLFFPNSETDPYTLTIIMDIHIALTFLLCYPEFEGEHQVS